MSFRFALSLLGLASLEGLSWTYSFARAGHAQSTYIVNATTTEVWKALGTATSPEFRIPMIVNSFPQSISPWMFWHQTAKSALNRVLLYRSVQF